jgi:hypothetical protein
VNRQYRDAGLVSNDRNEIYDRRDKKKRRTWRDERHHESRRSEKESTKPSVRDDYEDDSD